MTKTLLTIVDRFHFYLYVCRVTWDIAPPRGKAPPHLNTNLVCEWVHLMSNDVPCWKSVYEPNKLELNNNLCK